MGGPLWPMPDRKGSRIWIARILEYPENYLLSSDRNYIGLQNEFEIVKLYME